ncbi:hypothetical protein [Nitrospira tepida]|uniref:hypothetical protein n=1 Tax=Nitrospira tepida TaxID=2973512 RepID=UPI00259CE33A|nr:hypothetical protein [Nitrospira tepida]
MRNTSRFDLSIHNPGRYWSGSLWARVVVEVFVWSLCVTCLDVRTTFSSEEVDPHRGFIDGTVTAIRDKAIYVDERPYAVKSSVEVKDQSGQPVEYRKIEAGDRIRYLVQDGMIVKIIVIQPS